MDLGIKSYNHYRAEVKFKLTEIYAILSMVVCVLYSISFIAIGANQAAFIQLIGAFVFMTMAGLLRRNIYSFVRYIALITSLVLVYIQSIYMFSGGYGFHYQLFPLVVVIFLLFDFNITLERYSIYVLTISAVTVFFACEWMSIGHAFEEYLKYERLYFAVAILCSFIGMLMVLYYLSMEIFSTKDQLYAMATIDVLTGLYNRRTFIQRGEEYFKVAQRGGNQFSVVIFDIDYFKSVNDEYGHQVGDYVLKEFARLMKETVRETDLIARYGGEEFAILLPNTTPEQSFVVAEKLRQRIGECVIAIEPYEVHRTISLGIMGYALEIASFDDMLDKADKAMYKAKYSGKNQTIIYEHADTFYKEKRQIYAKPDQALS